MQALTEQEIIDIEPMEHSFPEGNFIALVKKDSFDEDAFEFFHPNCNPDGWIEVIVGNSVAGSYVSDGDMIFIDNSGNPHYTNDSVVKHIDNVILMNQMPNKDTLCHFQ